MFITYMFYLIARITKIISDILIQSKNNDKKKKHTKCETDLMYWCPSDARTDAIDTIRIMVSL